MKDLLFQIKKEWSDLSPSEKAEIMKVGIRNGIKDLIGIKEAYNEFAGGGKIHIDSSKKGTFTTAASKHGKSVQEFASQVLAHPENYSPAMRKKANFARNAAKWHGYGGHLFGLGDHLYTANSEGVYMPEVSVYAPDLSKPRQYFVGYDENANPIYTTNYQESQKYLQNNQPKTEQEKEREAWKTENLNHQGTTYPGLQGDAADIAKLAEVGIGLPMLATNPVIGPLAGNLAKDFAVDLYTHPIANGVGFATSYLGGKADESLGITEAVNNSLPKNQQLPNGAIGEFVGYPLGRFSKEIGTGLVKATDWAARKAYAPYDFYRTIGETTPRLTPTYASFRVDDLIGTPFAEHVYTGSPIFELGQAMRTSPEKAYFMIAPKDIDILKLKNGAFRSELVGNEIIPSGEVGGKFVSYGEPWQEFAMGEPSALYEFPIGRKRGPSLMATDWKGRPRDYSVDEIFDYMQQERALDKELYTLKKGDLKDFQHYLDVRRQLLKDKYPSLTRNLDTSIHAANQTVIPNEKWNFDRFLSEPFWKYSENPITGQVQKELFMRPPSNTLSISRTASQKALGGHLYDMGSYKPSKQIKDRIAAYEGKSMTGAIDPLSGKYHKNNSFEAEASGFYKALPESIRAQVLNNPELADNLYSYSYNVGAGNFKSRVVPALEKYYAGIGTAEDVANSMWASGDSKLRGLQRRRAEEKAGVLDALGWDSDYDDPYAGLSAYVDEDPGYTPWYSQVPEVDLEPTQPLVEAANEYSQEALDAEQRQRNLDAMQMIFSMNDNNGSNTPLLNAINMMRGNYYANGGHLSEGLSEPS